MRVVISGASGLVGRALTRTLVEEGHEVAALVRRRDQDGIYWNLDEGFVDVAALEGAHAVVHLAGEPVAGRRWSANQKRRILHSRVQGTACLAEHLAALRQTPRVWLSGSAVGFYGAGGAARLTEVSPRGEGFLAGVCERWEQATAPAEEAGIRVAHLRTGVVLALEGGALAKMLPAFRWGLGGPLGGGAQCVPWIHLADEVGAITHLLGHEVHGPVNLVAPHPVPQRELARTLGRVLGRPAWVPTPALVLRGLMGRELADELLLAGQNVAPVALQEGGFVWRHPHLEGALRDLLPT